MPGSRVNLRAYGVAPFNVAVIHGGPGAGGEMAPVARQLSSSLGVLEPIQTATSLEGQVQELRMALEHHADLPVTLIGFSWGAWLSYLVAAEYPALVRKLILVGSGPFEERYIAGLQETRLGRLSEAERAEFASILRELGDSTTENQDALLARLGALTSKADAYDPIVDASGENDAASIQADVYQGVWADAAALRRSGKLLALGKSIQCPVVAIHGDHDPHPAAGVQEPLSTTLARFRFVLLEHCGHRPWTERQAREAFYQMLEQELG